MKRDLIAGKVTCLLMCILSSVFSQQTLTNSSNLPQITFITSKLNSTIGKPAELLCVADTLHADDSMIWKRILFDSPNSTAESIDSENHQINVNFDSTNRTCHLKIRQVQVSDLGTYICEIQPYNVSRSTQLEVFGHPYFYNRNVTEVFKVYSNSTVSLDCDAGGIPQPNVYFQHYSHFYGDPMSTSNSSVLKFDKITKQDTGIYNCIAQNSIGNVVRNFEVKLLQYAPVIHECALRKVVKLTTFLVCKVESHVKPEISWFKDGLPLHLEDNSTFVLNVQMFEKEVDLYDVTLRINNTLTWQYGVYSVRARNEIGEDEMTGVEFLLKISEMPNENFKPTSNGFVVWLLIFSAVVILLLIGIVCMLKFLTRFFLLFRMI
ncbi:lachesin-like [Planococcus citri]|uniref:lachesin-like n=1 Tax=Planococcus citri TaxID=170843 RepID=UPI0031F8C377